MPYSIKKYPLKCFIDQKRRKKFAIVQTNVCASDFESLNLNQSQFMFYPLHRTASNIFLYFLLHV